MEESASFNLASSAHSRSCCSVNYEWFEAQHRSNYCSFAMQSRRLLLSPLFLLLSAFILLASSSSLVIVDALIIRVPSSSEYCFFEEAMKADKIVGNFRVLEGGGRDIDLRISDPLGKTVFEVTQKELESFQFFAQQTGAYTLCLSNRFSMVTGKTVKFNLYVGHTLQKKDAAKSEHFSPLETNVMKLSQGIREVSDWTSHMKSRERVHHQTVVSTNFRVVVWRIIQIMSLLFIAAAKILYLRNMFETKRGA